MGKQDVSYTSLVPSNLREIGEVIGNASILVLEYDGVHCPHCQRGITDNYHACPVCGWQFLPMDGRSRVGTEFKARRKPATYGESRCALCGVKFAMTAPNRTYCDPCRLKRKLQRNAKYRQNQKEKEGL